jgi:hypothetical protein
MKNILSITFLLTIALCITSCGGDPVVPAFTYPQKFTFKGNFEFDKSAAYVINANNTFAKIDINSGSFQLVTNDSIKRFVKDFTTQVKVVPVLISVEFLSKDSIRISTNDKNGNEQFGNIKADVENVNGIIFPINQNEPFNLTYDKANNRLKWCTEFLNVVRKSGSKGVLQNSCTDTNFDNRINSLIPEVKLIQGDSLSLRYLNYIFEK